MQPFLIALQFLTRIPISLPERPSERSVANSVVFYPIVGLMIGSVMFLFAWLLPGEQEMLHAAVLLAIWVLLTGGMHLDGLADSADAWAGGFNDKGKTLQIMKDPRCGPAAVVILTLTLILKFSALVAILQSGHLLYLLVPPLLSRATVPLLLMTTPYVRKGGLGCQIAAHVPVGASMLSIIISLLTVFLLLGNAAWGVIFVLIASFIVIRHLMVKRIDGATGDTIGALIELTETMVLIAMVD
ncbi:MAG: adenosylcobinamide-GDP ribazoletransferase [Gammaproteobacteria bacterium]|nr:adenosylcobinamide-GDP ribazoletransferase [Gammaproteobacteria bacterium]